MINMFNQSNPNLQTSSLPTGTSQETAYLSSPSALSSSNILDNALNRISNLERRVDYIERYFPDRSEQGGGIPTVSNDRFAVFVEQMNQSMNRANTRLEELKEMMEREVAQRNEMQGLLKELLQTWEAVVNGSVPQIENQGTSETTAMNVLSVDETFVPVSLTGSGHSHFENDSQDGLPHPTPTQQAKKQSDKPTEKNELLKLEMKQSSLITMSPRVRLLHANISTINQAGPIEGKHRNRGRKYPKRNASNGVDYRKFF